MIKPSLRSTWAFVAYLAAMTLMALYAIGKTPVNVSEVVVGYFMWLTIGTGAYLGKRLGQRKIKGASDEYQEDLDLPIR